MGLIGNWQVTSGAWAIGELTKNDPVLKHLKKGTKYLYNNGTAGIISLPISFQYGTIEFDLYVSSSYAEYSIQNNNKQPDSGSQSYNIKPSTSGVITFNKVGSALITTASSRYSYLNWYRVKWTRNYNGQFTIYIKGGIYGNRYVKLTPSSGINPIIDTTYTLFRYFTMYSQGTGLCGLANLQITQGITV